MQKPLFILSFILSLARCWHPTGHFLTAQVAYIEITQRKPSLMPKIEKLLEIIKPFTKERQHSFVESACFPDDIKYLDWSSFNKWHFYDDYIIEKGYSKELAGSLHRSKINILAHIGDAKATLKNKNKSYVDDRLGKSFEMRYLVHLIGDIHQPLHSTSLVSKDFPKGDAGGNAFTIDHSAKNLHTLWDKGLSTKLLRDTRAPLFGKDWEFIDAKSKELIKNYPRTYFDERLKLREAGKWIKESRKIAQEYAYKGLTKGSKITDDYINKNFKIVEEQIVLGGYRLADVLLEIFEDETVFEKHLKTDTDADTDEEVSDVIVTDDKEDKDGASTDTGSDPEDTPSTGKVLKKEPDTTTNVKPTPPKKKYVAKQDVTPAIVKIDLKPIEKKKAPRADKKFKAESPPKKATVKAEKKKAAPARRNKLLSDDYAPSSSDIDDEDFYLQKNVNDNEDEEEPRDNELEVEEESEDEEQDKPNIATKVWQAIWRPFGFYKNNE